MLNNLDKLKQINEIYKNKEHQSLNDILESFSIISKNYNEVEEKIELNKYSNTLYSKCTEEEKTQFFNDQLQLIECLVTNSIYDSVGVVYNWKKIYDLLYDPDYAKVDKINRKVVYSTTNNNRPVGDISFQIWNGLQIIDLDIKDQIIADGLKDDIFNELQQFHWFLGICKSASKKSLHIWTKITPISIDQKNRRVEFLCNFRHKYSYIYIILSKYCEKYGYTKENIFEYMDMAMAKPQQGIFISSDNAYLCTNFQDLRLDANFETAFNTGIESVDWISHPDLKQIFSKLEWFINDNFDKVTNIEVSNIELEDYDPKKSKGKKHYKHAQRWQLANTLTSIFGEEKAFNIICNICEGTSTRELKGDIRTAVIHNKPISVWAVKELNNYHGFNIKIKKSQEEEKNVQLIKEMTSVETKSDPMKILNDKTDKIELFLRKDQYLSHIKDQILDNLSHITLLEAGAGYGKTEMIKAFKAKTLLILPFTSTIKAKVEASEVTKDWLYFYGNKKPTLQDILGSQNMSMTIDKFSHLNVFELDTANFEYIVIDESHLLFTSSYRDVMSPCIQRLANCKAKVIMMTGTPTGEMLFFPNIKHIKVIKEDVRIKDCIINLVPTKTEQLLDMCNSMATDVMSGRKIIFPTNNGNLYFDQLTGIIQQILDECHYDKPLKAFYYKKSKYGEESMDNININKTVGDNDIIFCTTYLSVGVDIWDKLPFNVYFNETWIPQDIEQFANRLRNNDLHLKIYLPLKDSNGIPFNYYFTQPLDLNFNQKDLMLARDLVKTCNDMLERNEEESKYNPIISSLLSANKFLKYDENDCKYYIDETTYKLKVFEERYSDYSKQLEVMIEGIKYYGYTVNVVKSDKEIDENKAEEIDEFMMNCRNFKFNQDTIKVRKFLNTITDANIDEYRELIKGNYSLFKDNDDINKNRREENNLYSEDIEILEKHTPIVLSLYKHYDCDTIREIYEFCIDRKNNRLNFTKLKRIRTFVGIESSRKKKRLDFPVLKFVKDSQKWAKDHSTTTSQEIIEFLAEWTCKYCNSIKDLIVDDKSFMESIFELVKEYWRIIIVQSKPKDGQITISPFELLWKTKQQLNNAYGNWNTQTFFLEQLIGEMKEEEPEEEEKEEELPEFEHTEKLKLSDIIEEIPNIIHREFDYFDYSEKDQSNERFLRKQDNTNTLKEKVFISNEEEEINSKKSKDMSLDLQFKEDEGVPF